MRRYILTIVFSVILFHSYSQSFPYNEEDYKVSMYRFLNEIDRFIKNQSTIDERVLNNLISLSRDSIYILSIYHGFDGCQVSINVIQEIFLPYIKKHKIIELDIQETDIDKWGAWFRIRMLDKNNCYHLLDFSINKENKLTSIIL